jgi:ATP-dependent DNA helicase RecG
VVSKLERLDLEELAEGLDVEVKKASGRDGQGECPKAFFDSYVAMANTQGGVIFLGLDEDTKGKFIVSGIVKPSNVSCRETTRYVRISQSWLNALAIRGC